MTRKTKTQEYEVTDDEKKMLDVVLKRKRKIEEDTGHGEVTIVIRDGRPKHSKQSTTEILEK